jgi:hypothetical protein
VWTAIVLCFTLAFGHISHGRGDDSVSIDNGILRLTVASDGTLTVDKRQGIEPTIRCAGPLYFTNGNFWWADPDQLHVGGEVDKAGKQHGLMLDQARAWATRIALCGSVTLTGDRLDRLDANRMKLLTQCLPSTGRTPGR